MTRTDEIGAMAKIMDSFADNLQIHVIGVMKKIAAGQQVSSVPVMDDRDEIGPALFQTSTIISNLIAETNILVSAAAEGRLSVRGNDAAFHGGYYDIVHGFNATLENIVFTTQ